MLEILVASSQKLYCRKEVWGYVKVIHKKEKEKEKKELRKKWTSVRDI